MTDEAERLARLDERSQGDGKRLARLEANQRYAVLAILGLVVKQLADVLVTSGSMP